MIYYEETRILGKVNLFHSVKEFIELIIAIFTLSNIREEWNDFIFSFTKALNDKGIRVPIFGERSFVKYSNYVEYYQRLFGKYGLKFSPDYLVKGGNPLKINKVLNVLAMAYHDQYEDLVNNLYFYKKDECIVCDNYGHPECKHHLCKQYIPAVKNIENTITLLNACYNEDDSTALSLVSLHAQEILGNMIANNDFPIYSDN